MAWEGYPWKKKYSLPLKPLQPLPPPWSFLQALRSTGLGGGQPPPRWIGTSCFPSLGSVSPAMKWAGGEVAGNHHLQHPSPLCLSLAVRAPAECQELCKVPSVREC